MIFKPGLDECGCVQQWCRMSVYVLSVPSDRLLMRRLRVGSVRRIMEPKVWIACGTGVLSEIVRGNDCPQLSYI